MKRTLTTVVLALGLLLALSACTQDQASLSAIKQAFPSSQYSKAVQVATCESGLDPTAVSAGGGNWGLFQINKVHEPTLRQMGYSWDQITDPVVNAKLARSIYDTSGWRAWSCN